MLYQNSSCTSTGVPRKNQMYSQLARDTSGFGDSRITASSTPSTIPIAIAIAVSSIVTTRPFEDRLVEQVFADDAPLEARVGDDRTDERDRDHEDHRRRDPAAGVADRDGPYVIGPPGRGRWPRTRTPPARSALRPVDRRVVIAPS